MYAGNIRINRCARLGAICIALPMTVLIGAYWSYLRSSGQETDSYSPRLTAHQIRQRSLALCASFCNVANLVQEPQFKDLVFHTPSGGSRHRPIWLAHCEADGKRYYVEYNDLTGNLICIMPANGVMANLLSENTVPVIKTPTEA